MQVGFPLARLISPTLLDLGDWTILFVFEAGLALACLAAAQWLPLPQGTRIHVFEKKDALSFVLLASGFGMLCAVLAQGRIQWWFEAPWIGWTLACAIVLIVTAAIHEHRRDNPLVDTRWVFTPAFVRFGLSILLVRILLSEQTFAAPALLLTIGMGPEQMQMLHGIVLLAVLAGIFVAGLLLAITPKFVLVMELAAPAIIAVAAFMDTSSTMLTHPQTFMFSQAMMGFAGTMFVCAAFLLGFLMLFARGIGSMVTFIVTFSAAQLLGGLMGPAIFGTFQIIRTQHHFSYLSENLAGTDPSVAYVVGSFRALQSSVISDPALLQASSLSSVAQQVVQQANILAYNDLFFIIAIAASAHFILSVPAVIASAKKMKAAAPPKPKIAPAKA